MKRGGVPDIVAVRRELHSNPELSLQEHATAKRIHRWLHALGLKPRKIAGTGVTATVKGISDSSFRISISLSSCE